MKNFLHTIAVAALWVAHKADPEWIVSLMKEPIISVEPEVVAPIEGGEQPNVA